MLRQADIVVANLENPIIEDCPISDEGFKFCASPRMLAGPVWAGVDVFSLANNHSRNYGADGLEQTKQYLIKERIGYTGDGRLEVISKRGTKFGFLGFNFVDRLPTQADYALVEEANSRVDILIASIHWGVEYTETPTGTQQDIASKLVESGVDVLAGHHPHWVQQVSTINGRPVYYSLGNFIFDQMWSQETRQGLAVRLTFQDARLVDQQLLPVYMEDFAQPVWVE